MNHENCNFSLLSYNTTKFDVASMLRYEKLIIQTVNIVILILTNCIVSMIIPLGNTTVYLVGEETTLLCYNIYSKWHIEVCLWMKNNIAVS